MIRANSPAVISSPTKPRASGDDPMYDNPTDFQV